jgi:hypothetical protein
VGSSVKFEEFWQHYLVAHSHANTRRLHFLGVGVAVISLFIGIASHNPIIPILGLVMTYALSWSGHLLFERNQPTLLQHPVWSLQCDVRMCRLWLTGRLDEELSRVKASAALED